MNVLDLFSGIGGFSLGLERAGMTTVAFCEIEPFCRQVLAKHWPGVPIYDDVRAVTGERLAADGIVPDLICGGFPCQDISVAGRGAGLSGERSGLWFEYLRVIEETRPRWVVVENVPALRSRGLDVVLGGLAALGYDAEWHCIPASAVGAPHRRDRVWLVAYADGSREHEQAGERHESWVGTAECGGAVAHAGGEGRREILRGAHGHEGADGAQYMLVAGSHGAANPHRQGLEIVLDGTPGQQPTVERAHAWSVEPDVGRVAHGVPARVDRLRALGNAVVPQIPELIGRAIMQAEARA